MSFHVAIARFVRAPPVQIFRRGQSDGKTAVERLQLIWETDGSNAKSPSSWREVMVRRRPLVNRSTQAVECASADARRCTEGVPVRLVDASRELRSAALRNTDRSPANRESVMSEPSAKHSSQGPFFLW